MEKAESKVPNSWLLVFWMEANPYSKKEDFPKNAFPASVLSKQNKFH